MTKRRKFPKMPDYEGMGAHSEYSEIQKARPLQSLSETDLTLPEFKILDAYLARINSHDPDKRTVRLEKGELEKALGVTEIKQDDLEKRLRHLFQIIKVKDDRKRKGFKLINLFEEADAEQDDDGLWQITLTCTASAREYVFNIDNLGYLRYRLKNVINLTSRYSYVLFLYLLDNRFRKTWSIDLVDLKALLNCNAERYKQFKFFNAEILKKCHKELCDKTDISFDYKPIKRGRAVSAVEFSVTNIASEQPNVLRADGEFVGQTSLFDTPTVTDDRQDYGSDELNTYAAACGHSFTTDEMKMIEAALIAHKGCPATIEERVEWLQELYVKLTIEELDKNRKPIKNRIKYFVAMIQKSKPPKKEKTTEQSYDLDAWEDMALSFDPTTLSESDKEDET